MVSKSRDVSATNSLAHEAANATLRARAAEGRKDFTNSGISEDLLEALRSFPIERDVEHCGHRITVSPFDFYAECPQCGTRMKLRALSAAPEIEDVFDAVFEWMLDPQARRIAEQRQQAIEADLDAED